ncbi:homocysteine S-methyltransferase family protein [Pseudomonas sp. F01002]|uniref:homocysteine S-methyltransferase family protein n=1 Tax=Pseudomonas sp. F01002 TaxID=2555724 RepID=UPI001069C733|nr:homocysteine S-methyltransferase family protein [Pseudomonas sp. F01002]TFB45742.1 homocysteine S-methyltransferase family protein [Pseudomonas sp. F01002]
MAKYRNKLPQLGDGLYIADGGIETTLIFHEGLELPDFAAFHLLKTPEGEAALRKYFRTYAEIAKRFGTGLILESATWRANADWGTRLGYMPEALVDANSRAIHLLEEIRDEYETNQTPVVISGCLGPRGDGYVPARAMSDQEAETYHQAQVETLAGSAADMVCAMTMNYVAEALGIVRAAQQVDMPVAISFTVETDGNLPTGQSLKTAIEQVDDATSGYPCYYMINCAHPTHFDHVVAKGGLWLDRIRGFRANASHKSHEELSESTELDSGNPVELGAQYARLKERLARLNVMGGCCGTDHRHVEQIAEACSPLFRTTT